MNWIYEGEHKMNLRKTIILVLIAIAMILALFGCGLGVTIEQRVQFFESDLNDANRDDMYLNFHPTLTADYGAITGDGQVFDDAFDPIDRNYTITISDQSNPDNVVGIIVADGGGFGGPLEIYFKMAQDGLDWMIEELRLEDPPNPPIVIVQ
jgi:hypothetical protein